jgi:hypothetical protein
MESFNTEFATALAAMQAEFATIKHNRTVEVKMKGGGKYSYRYTTYDAMLDFVRPILAKHKFSLTNSTSVADGKLMLITRLIHGTGSSLEGVLPVKVTGNPQDLGSELSYMKRYGAASLLGLAFEEEDDDGQRASQSPSRGDYPAPRKQQSRASNAGDDDATRRQKHLWAQVAKTREAMGLSAQEGEQMLRALLVECFGEEQQSTKTLTAEQHAHLIDQLKQKQAANEPPGEG